MKSRSFFLKLFLGNLLLVGLIVIIGGLIAKRFLDENYYQVQIDKQKQFAQISQQYIQNLWAQGQPKEAIDSFCKNAIADSLGNMRLTIIAADGTVLGDSSKITAQKMENHKTPDRPEVIAALAGQGSWNNRFSETLNIEFRYYARPVYVNGKVVAATRIAMPVISLTESRRFIMRSLLIGAWAAVIAAVILGLLLSWMWYAPLRQISRAARTIASGQLGQKVHVSGSTELDQLADALNEMQASLTKQIKVIAEQRANLETVVKTLSEGVVATDTSDNVVLSNQAADALLATAGPLAGQNIQSSIRVAKLVDLYRQAQKAQEPCYGKFKTEIAGQRRVFDALATPVEGDNQQIGMLLVFRDITEIAQAAEMKAEFVVNASHELRTPLATIRAAVDSLEGVGPADHEDLMRIVTILNRHVSRLEQLTNDLLDFHTVENQEKPLQKEMVSLDYLGTWVKSHFGSLATQNGLTLETQVPQSELQFESDRSMIELILQNLVQNAIKFTPEDGLVTCTFEAGQDSVILKVQDTGMGISPQDQTRVFERFYQADAARSGDGRVRGTGLGLAIVKHAVERLGASLKMESKLQQGTTITITIPTQE